MFTMFNTLFEIHNIRIYLTGTAAQNARKRLMLSQLSRRGSAGGLFGGGLSGALPLMMLTGGGGDGLGKMLMFSALTKGGGASGGQGGAMQQLLPLMLLTESGIM